MGKLKTLLNLFIETSSRPMPLEGFDQFQLFAKEEGLEIKNVRLDVVNDKFDNDQLTNILESAQGYWIRNPALLENPSIRQIVEQRLKEGAIAIADVNINHIGKSGIDFFQDLGVEPTSVRAISAQEVSTGDEYHIELNRERHPFAFRDTQLFKGIERLLLQSPGGIGCFGRTQAALAIPSSEMRPLELRTDRFIADFSKPELPIIAIGTQSGWKGRIIALNVGLCFDGFHNLFGHYIPGISALDNRQFAKNLLEAVSLGQGARTYGWQDIYALISTIERVICQLTKNILLHAAGNDEWFTQYIPVGIVSKCRERQQQENKGFPLEAYLDLLDHKAIWKVNWELFKKIFEQDISKTGALHFFQEVNEIRKVCAHITKQIFGGAEEPTKEMFTKLESTKNMLLYCLESNSSIMNFRNLKNE